MAAGIPGWLLDSSVPSNNASSIGQIIAEDCRAFQNKFNQFVWNREVLSNSVSVAERVIDLTTQNTSQKSISNATCDVP